METKDWRSNPRVSKLSIPIYPMKCKDLTCAFNKSLLDAFNGECESPRENKREKSAKCHYTTNKNFIEKFKAE